MIRQWIKLSFLLVMGNVVLVMGCSKTSTATDHPASANVDEKSPKDVGANQAAADADKVMVYYFHGDRRCRTCLGIQEAIEQAIKERFSAETAANKLAYQDINIDQDENKRFVEQFQISFSTMLVARVKGGKTLQWENCDKAWELAHEPEKLKDYATERIKTYLAKIGEK